MIIRQYQIEDQPQVVELWKLCFPDQPEHNKATEDIARKLKIQRELFLVAVDDMPSGHNSSAANQDPTEQRNRGADEDVCRPQNEESAGQRKVIGSAMAGYDGHRGWVYYVATHPDYQRQGVGKQLMDAVEKGLVKIGCPKLNLQVRADNHEVVNYYKSLGYEIEERVSMGKKLR